MSREEDDADEVERRMDREFHRGFDCWDSNDDYSNDDFADPGGTSALRAAGPGNPRNLPCPNCERPNRLTKKDVDLGYQCDTCADLAESGFGY